MSLTESLFAWIVERILLKNMDFREYWFIGGRRMSRKAMVCKMDLQEMIRSRMTLSTEWE